MASTEVIDLGSSDEEPPGKNGVIDLTIESSEDEDAVMDVGKALNIANAAVAERAAVPPPVNGIPPPPRTQVARQQSPIEDSSSHSETTPVRRKNRKKRSLNNPHVAFRILTPPSPRSDPKARVLNARRTSNASNPIEEEEPIKRPSHHGKNGLRVFRRPANGTKNSGEGSAPKTKAGAVKQTSKSKALPTEKAPKKKIVTVKNVLNASLESLVPAAPRTEVTISNDSEDPIDDPPEKNFPEYEMDPISSARAPSPLPSPPLPTSPPPARRNPDYQPYDPEAASKGAGPSSQAHWYVAPPPAGWHSQSASAYPYLPPLRRTPLRPTKPTSFVPSTEAGPSTPLKLHKSRKRNRTVLSEDESDDWRPPTPKKRKHSTGDADDDEEDLSTNLDRILKSVVLNVLGDQMETTDATEQGLGETEGEVDQLIDSAFEDDQEPLQPDQPATPPSAHVEEDSERPGFFDDPDTQMKASGSKPEETHSLDGNVADLEDSAHPDSNSAPLRVPVFLTRDPEEEKLRCLLDSYSDVLANYPSYIKGCNRPGLSPKDAPWVILRPFLERKLQLERIKLQKKRQNGSS